MLKISESLSLRIATVGDIEPILRIERSSYSHPWSEATLRDCFKSNYEIWVVGDGTEIKGYGVINAAAGEAHLLNICFLSEVRGRGMGKKLLLFLMSRGVVHKAEMMFLEVRESNGPAISLYSKVGFNEIGFRKGYYPSSIAGRENAIVMACDLSIWAD